jgi:hypothetical protein
MEYEIYDEKEKKRSLFSHPAHQEGVPHYYGHTVRRAFFFAALVMLTTLPFFKNEMAIPVGYSVLSLVVMMFAAGYTNPKMRWTLLLDTVIGGIGLAVFGFQSILAYSTQASGVREYLFYTNQLLAIAFLVGFYYSVKSVRGFVLRGKMPEDTENSL